MSWNKTPQQQQNTTQNLGNKHFSTDKNCKTHNLMRSLARDMTLWTHSTELVWTWRRLDFTRYLIFKTWLICSFLSTNFFCWTLHLVIFVYRGVQHSPAFVCCGCWSNDSFVAERENERRKTKANNKRGRRGSIHRFIYLIRLRRKGENFKHSEELYLFYVT